MATATELPTQMYIDGRWTGADDGKTLAVINPADESTIAEVAYGGRAEAERAIEAASRAFPGWRAVSVYDRAKVLKKAADLMRERAETIARTLTREQGKPLAEAKAEVMHSADTFEWFAEEGKRSYGRIIPPSNVAKRHYAIKHPVGVVGTITPWNFPAALPVRKIAPALVAGCTVVSRPADQTPLDPRPDLPVPGRRRPARRGGQPGDRRRAARSPTPSSRTRPCGRSASPGRRRSARS